MQTFLRQATASQARIIGPFVSDSDGKTPATSLTIANTDVQLMANGAASTAKNSGGATHRVNGEYSITLDATDTATVGELAISVLVSGALIVRAKFTVLEESVYDAMFGPGAAGYSTYGGGDTAGVTTLLSRLSSVRAGYLDKLNVTGVLAHTDIAGTFKADVSGLSTYDGSDTAGVTALLDRLTAARAAYLDKLNVAGVLANTDNADTFKADISGVSTFNPATDEIESGVTYQKAWQGEAAVLLGAISTAGEASEIYAAVGNPGTTRVTVGATADGDRTTVVIA